MGGKILGKFIGKGAEIIGGIILIVIGIRILLEHLLNPVKLSCLLC